MTVGDAKALDISIVGATISGEALKGVRVGDGTQEVVSKVVADRRKTGVMIAVTGCGLEEPRVTLVIETHALVTYFIVSSVTKAETHVIAATIWVLEAAGRIEKLKHTIIAMPKRRKVVERNRFISSQMTRVLLM